MATAPAPDPNKTKLGPHNWPHEPLNPHLDMVADDLITILQHILSQEQPPSGVDLVAPTTVATADPVPNAIGWHMEDVAVELTAVDEGGSGVKEIEHALAGAQMAAPAVTPGALAQQMITAEGATTVTFFARDNDGNTEALQSVEVKLDKTPPQINAVTDVPPNANGWNNTNVTVMFPASDAVSGLAFSSPDVTVSTEGAAQDIIGTAEDMAGNQAAASAILNIDKTAPGIALASRTPAANTAGWNNTDVSFTWDCTDALSGPAAPSVTQSLTSEGAAQMVIGTCTDLAGNSASDTQSSINIDKTQPAISITTPAEGAAYLLNASVNSSYACTDGLSGVQSCTGTLPDGAALNTSSVGARQFTVNSSDAAGNSTSVTHNYSVHYAFSGFANPIGPLPMANVVNAGRTVPVKYFLQDAGGAFIFDLASFVSLMSGPLACDASAPGVLAEETDAAGSTAIRYDATGNQFIYNWKTDASWAGTCRALQLTLADGTQHWALFQFK
ncbi:MAG: PxKF domain-containing protein [Candidatus Acidiferrales bacterium]